MGVKWLIVLIGPPYLIGIWFIEDQRANIIKMHVYKRKILIITLYSYSEHNWEGPSLEEFQQSTIAYDSKTNRKGSQ